MLEKKEQFQIQCGTLCIITSVNKNGTVLQKTPTASQMLKSVWKNKKKEKMKGCEGQERMKLTDIVVLSFSHCERVMSSLVIALAEERWTDTKWKKKHETHERRRQIWLQSG